MSAPAPKPSAPTPKPTPRQPRRLAPWLWGGAALTALLGSALALSLGQETGKLAAGVRISGVEVGGLSSPEAKARLAEQLPKPPQITVKAAGKSWQVPANELGWQQDTAAALAQAEAYTAERTLGERLSALTGTAQPADFAVTVKVDENKAASKLGELTAPLTVAPKDGEIKFDAETYRYVVSGGREGKGTDTKAAAKAWATHPETTELQVPFTAISSAHSPTNLKKRADEGNALIRPLKVQPSGSESAIELSKEQVANLFWATKDGIKPDPEALDTTFKSLMAQLNKPATPARFVKKGGQWVPKEGKAGYEINAAAAREQFEQDALGSTETASIWPAEVTQPSFSVNELPDPNALELVAVGESVYYGSSAARRENIRNAADKLDGYVVPAGGNFSFLQAIGSISTDNGFVDGLIISGGETVDGLGGGVCQVSTTAFRALYKAGLPVVERNQHSYRVGYYEPQTGFEAAVYDPGLDLVMKNDTGAPLVVRTINNNAGSKMRVELWGKKPKRQVKVSDAVITAYLPAPAPRTVINRNLAPGQRRYGEGSRGGTYMYITRTITDAAGTRSERLDTRYEPWAGIIEVGPQ